MHIHWWLILPEWWGRPIARGLWRGWFLWWHLPNSCPNSPSFQWQRRLLMVVPLHCLPTFSGSIARWLGWKGATAAVAVVVDVVAGAVLEELLLQLCRCCWGKPILILLFFSFSFFFFLVVVVVEQVNVLHSYNSSSSCMLLPSSSTLFFSFVSSSSFLFCPEVGWSRMVSCEMDETLKVQELTRSFFFVVVLVSV